MATTMHHALYPKRALYEAYGKSLERDLSILRNQFVVMLPEELHRRLHDELDVVLLSKISPDQMPTRKTIQDVLAAFRRDTVKLQQMDSFIEQLKWLRDQFNPKHKRNRLVRNQLILQIHFLERNLRAIA